MNERRRHRLIWTAVGGVHLAALGAAWVGGFVPAGEPAREGGVFLVALTSEPIAVPGEATQGVAVGAGTPTPTPVAVSVPAFVPPVVPIAVVSSPAPAPKAVAVTTPAPAVATPAPVAEVFTPPAFLTRPEPAYPERARRAGAEGVAVVRLLLTAEGAVERAELTTSSGHRLLDEAALAAARASTFTPAERARRPVAAEAVATYRFELR